MAATAASSLQAASCSCGQAASTRQALRPPSSAAPSCSVAGRSRPRPGSRRSSRKPPGGGERTGEGRWRGGGKIEGRRAASVCVCVGRERQPCNARGCRGGGACVVSRDRKEAAGRKRSFGQLLRLGGGPQPPCLLRSSALTLGGKQLQQLQALKPAGGRLRAAPGCAQGLDAPHEEVLASRRRQREDVPARMRLQRQCQQPVKARRRGGRKRGGERGRDMEAQDVPLHAWALFPELYISCRPRSNEAGVVALM